MRRTWLWGTAIVVAVGLSSGGTAVAKDSIYTLPKAEVTAEVARDGSVRVSQEITFSFTGEGHGAYVDVPRPNLSKLTAISVSEDGRRYDKGADAEIGVERPAGTFGEKTCSLAGAHRIVWYFDAPAGSTRTFRLDYTLHRAVTAYEEHAFLRLPLWGTNWSERLEQLDVTVRLPRTGKKNEVYAAHGEPSNLLDAKVGKSRQVTTATAENISRGRAATLHLAFPTDQLDLPETRSSTRPVRVMAGDGARELGRLQAGKPDQGSQGTDCPVRRSASGGDSSGVSPGVILPILGLGVLVLLGFLFGNGDGGSSGGRYHRSRYRSSRYSGGSRRSSSSSRSSGGSSGGGGGAW